MRSIRKRARMQNSLVILALCVAAYYALVYLPLCRRVGSMAPAVGGWGRERVQVDPPVTEDLNASLERTTVDLESLREMSRQVQELERVVEARIEPDAVTRARMSQPFQLIEFQNERLSRLEELSQMAKASGVELSPMVGQGFPEHLAEQAYPELLWPQLQLSHLLIAGAIQSGISTVALIRVQPVQFHRGASGEREWLAELPMELEFGGSASAALKFLEQLPMRAGEIKARGLPEAPPAKPVMFIRGLIVRKVGRETPDRVQVELTASSFVRLARPAG